MYIPYTGSIFTVSNYNIYKLLSLYLAGAKLQKYFVYHIISTIQHRLFHLTSLVFAVTCTKYIESLSLYCKYIIFVI